MLFQAFLVARRNPSSFISSAGANEVRFHFNIGGKQDLGSYFKIIQFPELFDDSTNDKDQLSPLWISCFSLLVMVVCVSFNNAGLSKFTFTYLADTFIQMSLQMMHMTGNLSYKPTFIVNIDRFKV